MRVLGVLVAYNCKISLSKTFISLKHIFETETNARNYDFTLLFYDNSLQAQTIYADCPFNFQYIHTGNNLGVLGGYNFAYKTALKESYDWILLLDQDTEISRTFLSGLFIYSSLYLNDDDIVAIIPKLVDVKRVISPSKVKIGGIHRPVNLNESGVLDYEISALGSTTLIKTKFLIQLKGFSNSFWLDCLDRWLFSQIYKNGKKTFVLDVQVAHELSINDFDACMNEKRYKNLIDAEKLYMKKCRSKIDYYIFILRLLYRLSRFIIIPHRIKYAKIIFKSFFH